MDIILRQCGMPQHESQTRDNCYMPLSAIQFLGTPPKDPQDTTDNHHPFEIAIYIQI